MGNTIKNKPNWLGNLRLIAGITSLILIFFYVPMVILMGLLINRPAPASDYIILASCSIYVIGLLIGFKREGLGGLISFGFLVIVIIYLIYYCTGPHYDGKLNGGICIVIFILMIPCILFILFWYFHRKLEINHTKSE